MFNIMQLRLFLKGTKNQMVHFPFNKYVLSLKIGLIFCLFSQRPLIYVRLNPTSPYFLHAPLLFLRLILHAPP